MAVVADRVVVELEAKLDKYNQNVKGASNTFQQEVKKIEGAAGQAEARVAQSFGRMGRSIAGLVTGNGGLGGLQSAAVGVGQAMFAANAGVSALVVGVGALLVTEELAARKANEVNRVAEGLGRAAGLTGEQLRELADSSAKAGDVSQAAAEKMAEAYVSTGQIGGEITGKLIGITKDFADTMGIKAKAATKELADGFADPTRAAEEWNAVLGFANDKTIENIRNLQEQGDQLGAQRALYDALVPALSSAEDHTTSLGDAWAYVARKAQDAFTWITKAMDRNSLASKERQLDQLESAQRNQRALGLTWLDPGAQKEIDDLKAEIAQLKNAPSAARQRAAQVEANRTAQQAGDITRNLFPNDRKLHELEAARDTLVRALQKPELLSDVKATQDALKKTNREIAALGAGYSSAAAQDAAGRAAQRRAEAAAAKAQREREAAERKALEQDARTQSEITQAHRAEQAARTRMARGVDARADAEEAAVEQARKDEDDALALQVQRGEITQAQADVVTAERLKARAVEDDARIAQNQLDTDRAALEQQQYVSQLYSQIAQIHAARAKTAREAYEIELRDLQNRQRLERQQLETQIKSEGLDISAATERRGALNDKQAAERGDLQDQAVERMKGGIIDAYHSIEEGNFAENIGHRIKEAMLENLAERLARIFLSLPMPGAEGGNWAAKAINFGESLLSGTFLGGGPSPTPAATAGATPSVSVGDLIQTGGRAAGGDVVAGVPYRVNENGQLEGFVPAQSGRVIPLGDYRIAQAPRAAPVDFRQLAREVATLIGDRRPYVKMDVHTPDANSFHRSKRQTVDRLRRELGARP